jgi:hypothetical protein
MRDGSIDRCYQSNPWFANFTPMDVCVRFAIKSFKHVWIDAHGTFSILSQSARIRHCPLKPRWLVDLKWSWRPINEVGQWRVLAADDVGHTIMAPKTNHFARRWRLAWRFEYYLCDTIWPTCSEYIKSSFISPRPVLRGWVIPIRTGSSGTNIELLQSGGKPQIV